MAIPDARLAIDGLFRLVRSYQDNLLSAMQKLAEVAEDNQRLRVANGRPKCRREARPQSCAGRRLVHPLRQAVDEVRSRYGRTAVPRPVTARRGTCDTLAGRGKAVMSKRAAVFMLCGLDKVGKGDR